MSDSYFSGDVRQAVGCSSPGFKGEIRAGDINMGVNVQIVFKAMRLDEITKRVSFKREEVQRLSPGTLQMLRIQGDEEEPAKETESGQ